MADGNENGGVVGAASRLGQSVVSALPPAFLLLVIVNMMFIGIMFWFLERQQSERNAMIGKFVDRCLDIALQATPPPPK
jgi:hypothetical protein